MKLIILNAIAIRHNYYWQLNVRIHVWSQFRLYLQRVLQSQAILC